MASNDDLPELPREDASSRTHAPNISRKDDMVSINNKIIIT